MSMLPMYYQQSFYFDFHQIEFHFSQESIKIEMQLFSYFHLKMNDSL